MRTMVEMTARRDFEYDNRYNRALQSRIHDSLSGTRYEQLHESNEMNLFSYSLPIPPRGGEEGDTRRLIFAGADADLVATITAGLCKEPELNLHEMPFHVDQAFSINVPIGDTGTLTTGTPIIIRFGEDEAEEYGIDTDYSESTYWRAKHGTDLFFTHLNKNLQYKYQRVYDEEPPEPPYFTGYSMDREVVKPLSFGKDAPEVTFIGYEWSFDYEVESGKHRKLLNLTLDTGLGELNGLGFGFMNRDEDVNNGSVSD